MTKFSFLGFVLAAITFGSGCISYSSTTKKAPTTLRKLPPIAVGLPEPIIVAVDARAKSEG